MSPHTAKGSASEEVPIALPLYLKAGFPLSGTNIYHCVTHSGSTQEINCGSFISRALYRGSINSRYKEMKGRCECYSLQEVYERLLPEATSPEVVLQNRLVRSNARVYRLSKILQKCNGEYEELQERYNLLGIEMYWDDLMLIREKYLQIRSTSLSEVEKLKEHW